MVEQDLLQEFLGWLRCLVWNFVKGTVDWGEDGVVGDGAVEEDYQIWVFVDGGSELGGVLAR